MADISSRLKKLRSAKGLFGVALLSFIVLLIDFQTEDYFGQLRPLTVESVQKCMQHTPNVRKAHYSNLTILPGELPGYTGWARPASTLAHCFSIDRISGPAFTGKNWTVTVSCGHPEARSGGALFYIRAYGRSILPGYVTDHRNGSYDISILPFDAGVYQMEVVLSFSKPPPMSSFPNRNEPAHEGYLLPGFPLQFTVDQDGDRTFSIGPSRLCTLSEMLETSGTSALENGRWLVTKKVVEETFTGNKPVSLKAYQSGLNSLGFQMDYAPINCSLISSQRSKNVEMVQAAIRASKLPPKPFRVVMIGDSNMRFQEEVFKEYFGDSLGETHRPKTYQGISVRLPEIRDTLQELSKNDSHTFVLFNAGLHDILYFCTKKYYVKQVNMRLPLEKFNCTEFYRENLEKLVDMVKDFNGLLTVWQTTTAAWPKWGAFGFAWPPDRQQSMPADPTYCEHFNSIALEIMQRKKIPVMDAYWLSLSRQDHRQSDQNNAVGNKLAHPGQEVYSVLMRKFGMMILDVIQKGFVDSSEQGRVLN